VLGLDITQFQNCSVEFDRHTYIANMRQTTFIYTCYTRACRGDGFGCRTSL